LKNKMKNVRIDDLKANTVYNVRIMAENEYMERSEYSKEISVETNAFPKCVGVKLDDSKNLNIELAKESVVGITSEMNMKIQVLTADEKEQWMDVQAIKKDQAMYQHKLGTIASIFQVRFKIVCDRYSELSEIASFPMKEVIANLKSMDIALEYHSHRSHYADQDSYHPKNLLNDSDAIYHSEKNKTLPKDWIIFNMQKKAFIRQICIKNDRGDGCDVKKMNIYIGDGKDTWIKCKSNGQSIIEVAKTTAMQTFDIEVESTNHAFVKVEFVENHGWADGFLRIKQFKVLGTHI